MPVPPSPSTCFLRCQACCEALEGCIIQDLDHGGGEAADGDGKGAQPGDGVDLDAAVAFSRCVVFAVDMITRGVLTGIVEGG